MIIGVPREVKDHEYRVAATPEGVEELVRAGHEVLVETLAGEGSSLSDNSYRAAGARLVDSPTEVFRGAEMILKVKEPMASEFDLLCSKQILFTFLHLAANEKLTRALIERRVASIGYETVQLADGSLPLLSPMSEIAGRLAVQAGANYLERLNGGRGLLLGGVAGVLPAKVLIIGGGVVGMNSAQIALGMGAEVTVIDLNIERLRHLSQILHGNLRTLASNYRNIASAVAESDLVIGGVLVPGARAPKLVVEEMIKAMQAGSVVVDVAIDQGGCIETCHPTTYSEPTFILDGVIHYGVTNMPAAVPRTSTYALSNATLPYVMRLAKLGVEKAVRLDSSLAKGVNVLAGYVTYRGVAEAFGIEYTPLEQALGRD
ncbi:MAG: alanine dehydrogenase [Dehalococcoidia bacterium]|nr:alanine dehydrogenase [Dehalococcoidia bacterium]